LCEEEEIFFIEDLVGNSKISQFKISKKILKISRANQKFWDKNKQNWKNSFEKNDWKIPRFGAVLGIKPKSDMTSSDP